MKRPLIDTKYLVIDWSKRSDGRRFKVRHLRRPRTIYVQALRLEIAVWYR